MLPGAAATVLGSIGIGGSSALARTLSPVAEPLFIASAVLITVGALTCSRTVALLVTVGNVLLYLSMFQLASGSANNGHTPMAGMSMGASTGRHGGTHADATSFYLGLALLLAALALSTWRRRRHRCRPVLRVPRALPTPR
jgi:hypothetical protein